MNSALITNHIKSASLGALISIPLTFFAISASMGIAHGGLGFLAIFFIPAFIGFELVEPSTHFLIQYSLAYLAMYIAYFVLIFLYKLAFKRNTD